MGPADAGMDVRPPRYEQAHDRAVVRGHVAVHRMVQRRSGVVAHGRIDQVGVFVEQRGRRLRVLLFHRFHHGHDAAGGFDQFGDALMAHVARPVQGVAVVHPVLHGRVAAPRHQGRHGFIGPRRHGVVDRRAVGVKPFRVEEVRIGTVVNEDAACIGLSAGGGARQGLLFRLFVGLGQQATQFVREPHAGRDEEIHFRAGVEQRLYRLLFTMGQGGVGAVRIGSVLHEDDHQVPQHARFPGHLAGSDEGQGTVEIIPQRVGAVFALTVDDALNHVRHVVGQGVSANGIFGREPQQFRRSEILTGLRAADEKRFRERGDIDEEVGMTIEMAGQADHVADVQKGHGLAEKRIRDEVMDLRDVRHDASPAFPDSLNGKTGITPPVRANWIPGCGSAVPTGAIRCSSPPPAIC